MLSNKISVINIVSSDEPLLVMEACDEVVKEAKAIGVSERTIVEVLDKFSWSDILADSCSLSLFSDIKLTDIRFTKAPNKEAQNALVDLVQTANEENLFLVRLPKLDKKQRKAKWFKAISAKAQFQALWPPKVHEFSNWIQQRARKIELQISADACKMLAEQAEGNLLAAKQSLDKLKLLYAEEIVKLNMVKAIASDNAIYSVFLCLDEAFSGRGERAVKMLKKFQLEAVAPISIVVNLTREVTLCNAAALAGLKGEKPMQALANTYLWEGKKRVIVSAVNRLSVTVWQKLMIRCAYLERLIKGQEKGNIWQEIELCLWMISGQRIWGRKS